MDKYKEFASIVYAGPEGERTALLDKESTSVGRLADQDICLSEKFASRCHASFKRVAGGYEVEDLGSAHGTWVNGKRIERARLADGDVLQFGSPQAMRFRFKSSSTVKTAGRSKVSETFLSALSMMDVSTKQLQPAAREMEQLNFLLNAARQLNAGEAKGDVLQALLRLAIQLTGVERGFVFLQDTDGLKLELGLRADGSPIQEDSTISHRAMKQAVESTERFSVSDTLSDGDVGAWASVVENSIRCIYCIRSVSGRQAVRRDGCWGSCIWIVS